MLLERDRLTSGSTLHAAGLVGQLRTSANITQLLGYSVELYGRLEAETGQATGWKMNGGLRLACNAERWTEVKRQATTAHSLRPRDAPAVAARRRRTLWPLMEVDDVVGAAFLPTDGQANPSDITQALAKGARMAGRHDPSRTCAGHRHRARATAGSRGVRHRRRAGSPARRSCSAPASGRGRWRRLAGVNVPLVSVQHQYLITEPIAGVTPGLPTLRDPDRLTYYKEEVGGLVMGGYEPNPMPWAERGMPERLRVPAARRATGTTSSR